MPKYFEKQVIYKALSELCRKYNISYGCESTGFGKELSEFLDKLSTETGTETNADVIRRMTNEQLAEFISRVEFGDFSAVYGVTFCDLCEKDGNSLNLDCDGCLRHWLDSPATDCFGILYETGGKDVENAD